MSKKMVRQFLAGFLLIAIFFVVGCDEIIIGSNLEKGDKYTAKGNYQKALECYMKAAEEYQARLGKVYSNKAQAQADALKMVEAYYKSGLTYEKLANDSAARAMFEKAMKNTYAVKESYYEKQQVTMPAGYYDRWVPGTYKDVYVDGYYKTVVTDGYYKEVYDDATGQYKQVWVDGTSKQVWVDGHYESKYIDGHYEKVWEPEHIEFKDVYKERNVTVTIDSPYAPQAKAKLGTTSTAAASAPVEASQSPEAKAAYDKMVKAYEAYMKAGSPASGSVFEAYKSAQEEYQKLSK